MVRNVWCNAMCVKYQLAIRWLPKYVLSNCNGFGFGFCGRPFSILHNHNILRKAELNNIMSRWGSWIYWRKKRRSCINLTLLLSSIFLPWFLLSSNGTDYCFVQKCISIYENRIWKSNFHSSWSAWCVVCVPSISWLKFPL